MRPIDYVNVKEATDSLLKELVLSGHRIDFIDKGDVKTRITQLSNNYSDCLKLALKMQALYNAVYTLMTKEL